MQQDLFVYGTLLSAPLVQSLLGWLPLANSARLDDFARYRVRGQSYPAIVEQPGSSVEGAIYSGLQPRDWLRLDVYEGEQYECCRVRAWIMRGAQPPQAVLVRAYVMRREYRAALTNEPWTP